MRCICYVGDGLCLRGHVAVYIKDIIPFGILRLPYVYQWMQCCMFFGLRLNAVLCICVMECIGFVKQQMFHFVLVY